MSNLAGNKNSNVDTPQLHSILFTKCNWKLYLKNILGNRFGNVPDNTCRAKHGGAFFSAI